MKDVKERRRADKSGLSVPTVRTGVPVRTFSPVITCEVLCDDDEQMSKNSRRARQSTRCARDASSREHCRILLRRFSS